MFCQKILRFFACIFEGRPEAYVDRDRLIAVTLGQQDIRETMVKSKIFVGNGQTTLAQSEEGQSFKILVQQAEHELHKGAHARALGYLNKAIKVARDRMLHHLRASLLVRSLAKHKKTLAGMLNP